MDEVRVWRRALSGAEVAYLRDKVVAVHHPGIAGYWRFEELSGNVIADTALVGRYEDFPDTPANSTGTLVNNTAGNGQRVFSSNNTANTAPVVPAPLPAVSLTASRIPVNATLSLPIFGTFAPGQPDRLYIAQQGAGANALVRIVDLNTGNVTGNFLTVGGIQAPGGEEGLLGLAFHPDYATNRVFYVYCTEPGGDNVVRRYFRNATNADVADVSSNQTILTLPHPGQTNHNGGWIAFGPDGCLYIGTGDGGGGNDPSNNAQNLNSLLGKILRIVPGTGDLWIGDVGQGAFEEIDRIPAGVGGLNFGWPAMEAFVDNPGKGDAPLMRVHSQAQSASTCAADPSRSQPSSWACSLSCCPRKRGTAR